MQVKAVIIIIRMHQWNKTTLFQSQFFNCRGIKISLNIFKLMLIPLQLKNINIHTCLQCKQFYK
jgi:hypothetical protein